MVLEWCGRYDPYDREFGDYEVVGAARSDRIAGYDVDSRSEWACHQSSDSAVASKSDAGPTVSERRWWWYPPGSYAPSVAPTSEYEGAARDVPVESRSISLSEGRCSRNMSSCQYGNLFVWA